MAACALMLLSVPATAQSRPQADPAARLTRHLSAMKKDQEVLRFLHSHRWLLSDPRFSASARRQLRLHTKSLARTKAGVAAAQRALARRARIRQLAVVEAASPQTVICRVFGDYCRQALAVSRCESRLRTDAQNGQYLGLFQMGSSERRLYGHGPSAAEQAEAAHRYFVASGHDWSPWSCKPWN